MESNLFEKTGDRESADGDVAEMRGAFSERLMSSESDAVDNIEKFTHPLEANTRSGTMDNQGLNGSKDQIITLNDSKAGMQGLDLSKINKIIAESSEGSKFYEHKKKVKQRLEQKATEMRNLYDQLPPSAVEESKRKVDKIAEVAASKKDDKRVIVHIDMDCFFAAVEMRDNPSLRDKPMAVGGNSMLSTSNYIARKFGVRAAMPGFIARKLCPNLVIIPPDFEKYSAASEIAANVYREYDPACYSCMDEASLDVTEYIDRNLNEGDDREEIIEKTVKEIRDRVCLVTNGLTCSAGISPVGFLSKICSDINKPNGQFRLRPSEAPEFLKNLKIRKVCGIGEATEGLLRALDIDTCGDIWERRGAINLLFKPATADFLFKVSLGIGKNFFSFPSSSSDSSTGDDRKSISCERTFSETGDLDFLSELCQRLASDLSQDLQDKNCTAKAIAVKIKTDTFEVRSRIRTLLDYTADADIIFKTAMSIFHSLRAEQEGMILRLFGLRISTLKFRNVGEERSCEKKIGTKQLQLFKEPTGTFECPICINSFPTSFSLRKHVEDCLNVSDNLIEKSEKEASAKKCDSSRIFECDQIRQKRHHSEAANNNKLPDVNLTQNETSSSTMCNKRQKTSQAPIATGEQERRKELGIGIIGTANIKSLTKNNSTSSKKFDGNGAIKMMPINFYFQNRTK